MEYNVLVVMDNTRNGNLSVSNQYVIDNLGEHTVQELRSAGHKVYRMYLDVGPKNIEADGTVRGYQTPEEIAKQFEDNQMDFILWIKYNSSLNFAGFWTNAGSSAEKAAAKSMKMAFPTEVASEMSATKQGSWTTYTGCPVVKFGFSSNFTNKMANSRSINHSAYYYLSKGLISFLNSSAMSKNTKESAFSDSSDSGNQPENVTEPSYELMDYEVVPTEYDIPTSKAPAIQASIDSSAELISKKIHERQLTLHSDYLVYFDDVLMNDYVLSYNTNIGVDVGIGRASVEMMYAPSFNKIRVDDTVTNGVDNGIQLKIFVSNPFSGKYNMVFDGIIKQKVLSRDSRGFQLTFSAVDYIYWMNKIIAPVSIPFNEAVSPGERLKWKAQSIDPELTANIEIAAAGSLKGKTLTEYFETLKEKSFTNSKIYSETNSVANWDDVINRVEIMGDINAELVKNEVVDFVINSNTTFADTVYVSMSNTTNNLLMELYQDRDGIVRIKPPFWNEPVLKDHIIDPMMILTATESTDWNKYYTRVIVTGGVEEWMPESGSTSEKVDLLTPVGVYVGSLSDKSAAKWADYTSEGERGSSYREVTTNGSSSSSTSDGGGNSTMSSNPSVKEFLEKASTGSFPAQEWGDGSGTQCVELPKYYIDKVFGCSCKTKGLGNGHDMWVEIPKAFPDKFEKVAYSSPSSIKSGDVISLTSNAAPSAGHAAVVKSVSGNEIVYLDQWKGSGTVHVQKGTISGSVINGVGGAPRTIKGMAHPKGA